MKAATATVLGFVVAPVVPVVVGGLLTPTWGDFDLVGLVALGAIAYCASLLYTAFLGIPLFVFLQLRGRINILSCVASGLLIGAIVAITVALPNWAHAEDLVVKALTGAAAGFLFWLIWSRGSDETKSQQETKL